MNGYLNGKPVSDLPTDGGEHPPEFVSGTMTQRSMPPVPPPHAGPPKRKPVRRMPVSHDSNTSPSATQRSSLYEGVGIAPTRSTGSNNSSNSGYPPRPLSSGSGSVPVPPRSIPYLENDNISPRTSSSSLSNPPLLPPDRGMSPALRSHSPSPPFYNSEEHYSSDRVGTMSMPVPYPGQAQQYQAQPQALFHATAQAQAQAQSYPQPSIQSQTYYQPQSQVRSQAQPQAHYQSQTSIQPKSQYAYSTPPVPPHQEGIVNQQPQSVLSGYYQPDLSQPPPPTIPPSSASPPPAAPTQHPPHVPPILVPTNNTYDSDQNVSPASRSSQQQFSHRRSGSAHSASSGASFSQPLYMSAPSNSNANVVGARPPISFPNPYASQTSFQPSLPSHSRGNSVSSRVSNNGTTTTNTISPAVSSATRSATTASSSSGNSALANIPAKPEIPGMGVVSAYVRQMRRNSAVAWSDASPKIWGLPVGISTKPSGSALVKTNTIYAKSLLRRAIDPRHSHLTPRLLASEIDDEDDDMPMNPAQAAAQAAAVAAAQAGSSTPTSGVSDGVYKFSASASLATSGRQEESGSIKSADTTSYGPLSRTQSVSSIKSVEEDIGKIRLFVANPDDS